MTIIIKTSEGETILNFSKGTSDDPSVPRIIEGSTDPNERS